MTKMAPTQCMTLAVFSFFFIFPAVVKPQTCDDVCAKYISIPYDLNIHDHPSRAVNTSVSLEWCGASCRLKGSECNAFTYEYTSGGNECITGKFATFDPHGGQSAYRLSMVNNITTFWRDAVNCEAGTQFSIFDGACYRFDSDTNGRYGGDAGKIDWACAFDLPGKNAFTPKADTPDKADHMQSYIATYPSGCTAPKVWLPLTWVTDQWVWSDQALTETPVTWNRWGAGYPMYNDSDHQMAAMVKGSNYDWQDEVTASSGCYLCSYTP